MSFTNEKELYDAIIKSLSAASLNTMEQTRSMLQIHIENVVYNGYSPEIYNDTFEFLDAWDVQSGGGAGGASMYYEPSFIGTVSPPYHASVVTGVGVAAALADWIFEGNSGGIFGNGGWNSSRDAWEALDKEMTNTKFCSMYEDGMSAVGIPWKRSSGAVVKIKD